MNEMLIYDLMPDYDEHICPVTAGGYCPYGTSSGRCASCEELKAMEEFYARPARSLKAMEYFYGFDGKDGEQDATD